MKRFGIYRTSLLGKGGILTTIPMNMQELACSGAGF